MLQTRKAIQAFRPFWITLLISAALLAWDCRRRMAPLTRITADVRIEGLDPDEPVVTEVDGRTVTFGQAAPLRRSSIRFSSPNCFDTNINRFIWYGVNDLGTVDLIRCRGQLTVNATPPADTYVLSGKRGAWTNSTGAFVGIPYGEYRLTCRYGTQVREIPSLKIAQAMETVRLEANLGFLNLVSETPGHFELSSLASPEVQKGWYPINIRHLPAAEYQLVEETSEYKRTRRIHIKANETNRLELKATYGSLSVTTEPAGATVALDGRDEGITPFSRGKVLIGTCQLQVTLFGHDAFQGTIEIEEDGVISTNLVLTNTRYRIAMEEVERYRVSGSFESALEALEIALQERPGDVAATALLKDIRPKVLLRKASVLHRAGDFDGALAALDQAVKDAPESAEVARAREQVVKARDQAIQDRNNETFGRLMNDARQMAARKEFSRALGTLSEAEKIKPNQPEVAQLRTAYQAALSKQEAEKAEQQRKEEIVGRRAQLDQTWRQLEQQDPTAKTSRPVIWRTKKTAVETKAALERAGSGDDGMPMSAYQERSPRLFTAHIRTTTGINSHGKIAVAELASGLTEIRWGIFRYDAQNLEPSQNTLEHFFSDTTTRFQTQLRNQLEGSLVEIR
jgi:tetratricopeptide (TPR) repeat protein